MAPLLSAFFPAYNDAGTIASMVVRMDTTIRTIIEDYEIIVINDGSRDWTPEVLDDLAKRYPKLRVIHHPKNTGYGGALRSGFRHATGELVFYTDGDAQYDPGEFLLLHQALTPEMDVVNGYKITRHDPFHRKIIGRLYHWGVKILFGLRLRDVDCDFRLIRRRVFDRIALQESTGAICVELMVKIQDAGFRLAEVPVHHFHRAFGVSQFFNFPRIFKTLRNLLRLWWQLRIIRWLRPKES